MLRGAACRSDKTAVGPVAAAQRPHFGEWHYSNPEAMTRRLAMVLILAGLSLSVSASVSGCDDGTGPCCRVCREGKACGDTCISRDATCTRGPGCACDG